MKSEAIKKILINAKNFSQTKTEDELFEIIGYEMKIKELQDENKKLRECVDWYIDLGLVEGYAENLLKKLK